LISVNTIKKIHAAPAPSIIAVAAVLPVHDIYSYTVPDHLNDLACPGKRVLVPFGRRTITGYILGPGDDAPHTELKHILDVLDDAPLFPDSMLPFFKWIASYYMYPLGLVINTALPAGLNLYDTTVFMADDAGRRAARTDTVTPLEKRVLDALEQADLDFKRLQSTVGQPIPSALLHHMRKRRWIIAQRRLKTGQVRPKTLRMVTLAADMPPGVRMTAQRQTIVEMLRTRGDLSVATLSAHLPNAAAIIRTMQSAGIVRTYAQPVYRDPFGEPIEPDTPPQLTDEQKAVLADMAPRLGNGFSTVLLAGVTGSGKTEIYLQMTQAALDRGLHVVVLVPEIALISQTERRFRARFGARVAVLHSGLSRGERYDQWRRVADGTAAIAIGARSCIFAPFAHIGLIIVDEEHDASYKQDGGLNYNARDLAVMRARQQGALVILGSATPSVQSWYNVTIGKYATAGLTQRVNRQPLPIIQTVDLSASRDARGLRRYVTPTLQQAIAETLKDGHQALIFLNRRGFAAFPICAKCNQPIRCKNCDITLTLHKTANAYRCHYCGFSRSATTACPGCGSEKIKLLGTGTEKIHEAMTQLFPGARVARMDRDTMTRKGAIVNLLKDLKARHIDILVGTQMVAKGHDFPGITLVGVVCADLTLNFPDFRAGERTFQLLAQVAGRAGRGDAPGKVILQTFNPDHFSIMAARHQDFLTFYNEEIVYRRSLGYPPFTRMVAIRLSSKDPQQVAARALSLGDACREKLAAGGPYHGRIQMMGPIEAPLSRIAGHHRWQLLFKSPTANLLHRFIRERMLDGAAQTAHRQVRSVIDVDPFFLM
jgi:primosomal protein N' (replication factor Y) (superfamily II helicase)